MKKIHAWLLAASMAVGLVGITPLLSAQSQEQEPGAQQPAEQKAQTFSGKISRKGNEYVLRDVSTKTTYNLDDQEKAKPFAGKEVNVTGTLDAQTTTIHVTEIQPSA